MTTTRSSSKSNLRFRTPERTVRILFTESQFVRLTEIHHRLILGGDLQLLGSFGPLLWEYNQLLGGGIEGGEISRELSQRLDAMLPALQQELQQAGEL